MCLLKHCADHLRSGYAKHTGNKLKAGYAHEIAAAYFGYGSAAALRADGPFPLTALNTADFLIPDLEQMDRRVKKIVGLPNDLPTVNALAFYLSDMLVSGGFFKGRVWQDRSLSDDINAFVQENTLMIEDDLSGEMAETNAYFDELYIEETDITVTDEALIVTLEGALNGETHEDRVFHGDKIAFTTVMTFERDWGRICYKTPKLETHGHVDETGYYDLEDV